MAFPCLPPISMTSASGLPLPRSLSRRWPMKRRLATPGRGKPSALALGYAGSRQAFGKPLIQHQVIRHKLVDMAQRVAASQAYLELSAWRMDQGEDRVADLCMLKNQATQT